MIITVERLNQLMTSQVRAGQVLMNRHIVQHEACSMYMPMMLFYADAKVRALECSYACTQCSCHTQTGSGGIKPVTNSSVHLRDVACLWPQHPGAQQNS